MSYKGFIREFGALLVVAVSGVLACARAAEVAIQLPPEVNSFKQDVGAEIANAQCLICHSVEYITTRPWTSIFPGLAIVVPVLAVSSDNTAPWLREVAIATAEATPTGRHQGLAGGFHEVSPPVLAAALTAFYNEEG